MSSPSLSNLVGKPVKERYGRFEGSIVAVETTPTGELKAIVYENGGVILKSDVSSIRVEESFVEIAPSIIFEAERLQKDVSIFIAQQEAIAKLWERGVISKDVYNEVQAESNETLKALKDKLNRVVEKLKDRQNKVKRRRDWIYRLFMNLEVVKKMRLTSDESYTNAYEKLERELFHTISEEEDVKRLYIDMMSIQSSLEEVAGRKGEAPSKGGEGEEIKGFEEAVPVGGQGADQEGQGFLEPISLNGGEGSPRSSEPDPFC